MNTRITLFNILMFEDRETFLPREMFLFFALLPETKNLMLDRVKQQKLVWTDPNDVFKEIKCIKPLKNIMTNEILILHKLAINWIRKYMVMPCYLEFIPIIYQPPDFGYTNDEVAKWVDTPGYINAPCPTSNRRSLITGFRFRGGKGSIKIKINNVERTTLLSIDVTENVFVPVFIFFAYFDTFIIESDNPNIQFLCERRKVSGFDYTNYDTRIIKYTGEMNNIIQIMDWNKKISNSDFEKS